MQTLLEKYPFLAYKNSIEEYVEPTYYYKMLKTYGYQGKDDLEFLRTFLATYYKGTQGLKLLELGCGPGRATQALLEELPNEHIQTLDVLDLSSRMLGFLHEKIGDRITGTIESDIIDFLSTCEDTYSLVYSLRAFSHSVHHHLYQGKDEYVYQSIYRFLEKCLQPGGRMFMIHFDSQSQEQRILLQQWMKLYPIFRNTKQQSPSKILIDECLRELTDNEIISYKVTHYALDAIQYNSVSEAIEIFANFHLESILNDKSDLIEGVVTEMEEYFDEIVRKKGALRVRPGCFVYEITRT